MYKFYNPWVEKGEDDTVLGERDEGASFDSWNAVKISKHTEQNAYKYIIYNVLIEYFVFSMRYWPLTPENASNNISLHARDNAT